MYEADISIVHFYKFDCIDDFCQVLKDHVTSLLKHLRRARVQKDPYDLVKRNGMGLENFLKESVKSQKSVIRRLKNN